MAEIDQNGLLTIHKSGSFKVCAVSNSDPSIRAEVSFASLGDVAIPDKTEISTFGDNFAMIQNDMVRVIYNLESGRYSAYDQESGLPYILNAYTQVNDETSIDERHLPYGRGCGRRYHQDHAFDRNQRRPAMALFSTLLWKTIAGKLS